MYIYVLRLQKNKNHPKISFVQIDMIKTLTGVHRGFSKTEIWTELVLSCVHLFKYITAQLGSNMNIRVIDMCLIFPKHIKSLKTKL